MDENRKSRRQGDASQARRQGSEPHVRIPDLAQRPGRYLGRRHDRAQDYLDAVEAVIVILNTAGQITLINRKGRQLLDYHQSELVGQRWFSLCLPQPQGMQEVYPQFLKLMAGEIEAAEYYENPVRTRSGELREIAWHNTLLRNERGQIVGVLSAGEDITERKGAEEALRQSEERYRFLVESVNDWIWEVDRDGVYTYSGPQCRQLLGYDPQEIVGKMPFDLMPPEEARRVRKVFVSIAGQAQPFHRLENINRRKDGRLVVLETNGVPILDAQGKLAGYRGVDRDITERKQAEEALRQKEYLLSESQRIGHIGTWSVDLPGDLSTWTEEMYRLFGVSPETFVPSAGAFLELLHPEDREAMRQWMRAALADEHPGSLEMRVVLPDGSVRIISGRGELIPAHDNEPTRLVGTAQDITAQKQAQSALQESEERYRILLEHGFDGIFVHQDFRIVQLNDRFAEMTGYPRAELTGAQAIALFPPDSQERIRQYIHAGTSAYYEVQLRRRDGRLVEVESYGVPCRFQGRSARIVGLRDITERKQAQEALRRWNEQLETQVAQRTEDLRRTVDRLKLLTLELSQTEDRERKRIADLLHDDVQQMLAGTKFHVNLLLAEPHGTEETRELLEQITQMLRETIEKVRNLSHELSPALYQADLPEMFTWLAQHMQRLHGLTVRVDAAGPVDSSSESLKALLFKVVRELLFNVVKHAGVREARIRVRRAGPCIALTVTDRGRGFDPQQLAGRPGFGLPGIRERIQLVGGRMKIRSADNQGSRFLILVPDPAPRDSP